MKRIQAIEKLALKKLNELSEDERVEQLEIMTLEDGGESEGWNLLPDEIQREFEEGELKDSPNSERYNQVLMIWLKDELYADTNHKIIHTLFRIVLLGDVGFV